MPTSPDANQGGPRQLNRREALLVLALKGGALTFADTIAAASVAFMFKPYAVQFWEWLKQQRQRAEIFVPQEVVCNAPIHTEYTALALKRTYTIASGDSIGEGYYRKGFPATPAARFATDAINRNAHIAALVNAYWESHTIAKQGSKITDVQKQLKDAKLNKILKTENNVDWWLSVGGNDIVDTLSEKADKIRRLAEKPNVFDPEFFKIDDDILNSVLKYQIQFLSLLHQIVGGNKNGNIKRLVIEGLPDLGKAGRIDYVSINGKIVESYPIERETFGKFFATNLSILINNAMKESINQILLENPNLDVLFIDNFHGLESADLLGEHPLPQGQEDMAATFFHMAYHAGQNLGRLLFPDWRDNRLFGGQRRVPQNPWVIQLNSKLAA